MAKNSKIKQRRRARSHERKKISIPKPLLDTGDSLLPSEITQVGDEVEPESKPLKITFEYYKDKLCGVNGLKEKQPLNVVRAIRDIGSSCNENDLLLNGIGTQIVHRENEYLKLYKGLDEEVVIQEHKIEDSTARIFYELLVGESLCRVIAITSDRHFETTKK